MVTAVFRTILAQPDPDSVAATWDQVRDQLASMFPKTGASMDDAKAKVLAFRLPAGALSEGLVDQPARADQQGDPSVELVDAARAATALLTVGDRAEV